MRIAAKRLASLVSALALASVCCFAPVAWADDAPAAPDATTTEQTQQPANTEAPSEEGPESVKPSATSVDADESNTIEPSQRADSTFIYDTTIDELAKNASNYEGQTVQITGEVIGDKINDANDPAYCWITLTVIDEKDAASVAIYMLSEDADAQIDTYGRYNQVGTTLQVRGTFNGVCDEHDGALDVHAASVAMTQKGKVVAESVNPLNFFPGIMLIIVAGILTGVFSYMREKMS